MIITLTIIPITITTKLLEALGESYLRSSQSQAPVTPTTRNVLILRDFSILGVADISRSMSGWREGKVTHVSI